MISYFTTLTHYNTRSSNMVGHKLVGLRITYIGLSGLYGISDQHFSIKAFQDSIIIGGYFGSYSCLLILVFYALVLASTETGFSTVVMDCYL